MSAKHRRGRKSTAKQEVKHSQITPEYPECQYQGWRAMPPITAKRKAELSKLRSIELEYQDLLDGNYPFKGVKLDRADVRWSAHQGQCGQSDKTTLGP
jgi:hypothetical protein